MIKNQNALLRSITAFTEFRAVRAPQGENAGYDGFKG